jgi:hypothetical protein
MIASMISLGHDLGLEVVAEGIEDPATLAMLQAMGCDLAQGYYLGKPQAYDVIVVDAFRGASPPLHLMTAEAFEIYLKHLAPDGVLAINFEIDTFDMAPLHRGLAHRFGLQAGWFETPDEGDDCDDTVSWALYTKDQDFLKAPEMAAGLSPWRDGKDTRLVWTDADANLMSIISWDKVLHAAD